MNEYLFDQVIDRRGSDSVKWSNYPDDVIPMWVADSDFNAPKEIVTSIRRRLEHPLFGYTGESFNDLLDTAARHWVSSRFGWNLPEKHSAFAPGVVSSICMAVQAFTRPGENVVTLSPAYPPLIHKPRQNGRVSLASPMRRNAHGHYSIDFEDLEEKLSRSSTSLFLLCNPHNPTGRVFSREELQRIAELCLASGVLIFSDEIHCDYVHQGRHIAMPTISPAVAASTLVSINPSKTFNIAGLHTAAVLSENPELLKRYKKASEAAGLHPTIPGVLGFHAAYTECAAYADAVREYVRANQIFAVDYITRNIPYLKASLPESTYLLWVDCRALMLDQHELERLFIEKARVAPSPGSGYNSLHGNEGENFIRLNLACPRSTVEEALGRIKKALR